MKRTPVTLTAFLGERLLASGNLRTVLDCAKTIHDSHPEPALLLFDDHTGEVVDVDYRGPLAEVQRRLEKRLGTSLEADSKGHEGDDIDGEESPAAPRGRGRPRLGVVAREVTLLPRHWEWLASQPGSVSVALRRLVDEARKRHASRDLRRGAQKAAYLFMSAMAGDQPNYEEAIRALFAGDHVRFSQAMSGWPKDVQHHAERLAATAFARDSGSTLPLS